MTEMSNRTFCKRSPRIIKSVVHDVSLYLVFMDQGLSFTVSLSQSNTLDLSLKKNFSNKIKINTIVYAL